VPYCQKYTPTECFSAILPTGMYGKWIESSLLRRPTLTDVTYCDLG